MKSVTLLTASEQKVCFNTLYAVAHERQILILRTLIYQLGLEDAFLHILSGCEPMKQKEKQIIYNALSYIKESGKSN